MTRCLRPFNTAQEDDTAHLIKTAPHCSRFKAYNSPVDTLQWLFLQRSISIFHLPGQNWLRETQALFDILRSAFKSVQSNETRECAGTCVEADERQKTTNLPALAPGKSIILLVFFKQPRRITLPESQFPCPQTKV
ncbi:hypothetical protein B0H10DRAFT_1958537 [Mycena sp. CBHHK59/15]|nr:hypothetical protein B0H10DRAFT_1958537 [Mycena sp. CBHHK59/15]